MDRILIILKKENGPRASSAPALGLNTIVFKLVYWYMQQISGEHLQDHWSSGLFFFFAQNFFFQNKFKHDLCCLCIICAVSGQKFWKFAGENVLFKSFECFFVKFGFCTYRLGRQLSLACCISD